MASKPDTWMPLYVGDYTKDTQNLTPEQHGAYLLLLMQCWNAGGVLPVSDANLAMIARMSAVTWKRNREVVLSFFHLTPEGYSQKRLTAELAKARAAYERRAEAGRKGGSRAKQCLSNAAAGLKQPQPHSPTFGGEETSQGEAQAQGAEVVVFGPRRSA